MATNETFQFSTRLDAEHKHLLNEIVTQERQTVRTVIERSLEALKRELDAGK